MKFASWKSLAALSLGLLSVSMNANAYCSAAQLAGTWGFSGQGVDLQAGGAPYVQLGALVLKSNGAGAGTATVVENGMTFTDVPLVFSNLTLDPATCLGKVTVTVGGMPVPHVFLILDRGREMHITSTKGNQTGLIIGKKQND